MSEFSTTIFEVTIDDLPLLKRGKVRDVFDLGENLLIVSSDRLSAFDVIMKQPIPEKGRVLNTLSLFWFELTSGFVQNHVVTGDFDLFPSVIKKYNFLKNRAMITRKTTVFPIEFIVRNYLSGSAWVEYKSTGAVSGVKLPEGLKESDKLPEIMFTPSTKSEIGAHDINITETEAENIIGRENLLTIKEKAISIFKYCSDYALKKGIIIADTKMEFGLTNDGEILLIDELFTPDSSRFWPMEYYSPGGPQISYDKQYVRDYLLSIGFNKQPPPPELPDEVIRKTSEKYIEIFNKLTGGNS